MKLINSFALLCCSLMSFGVMAQDKKDQDTKPTDPAKAVMAEEIEVVRPYKPVLANAVKIRRNPDLNDAPTFKPVLNYNLLDKKLELNTDIRQLQYQQLATPSPEALLNNYAKIGLGNLKTGLGEIYLNNGRDEALQTGFYAKHLNQQGELNKQQFSNQELAIFGKSIGNKFTLSGDVGYKRLGTYFYGYDPVSLINTNPEKQQLSQIELSGELANRYQQDPSSWAYALKVDANFFKNRLNGKENTMIFSGSGSKSWKTFQFGINTALDFTNVKAGINSLGNNILRANPFVKYQGTGFKLDMGLNFVQEFGAADRLSALPAIGVEAVIDPEFATLFAGFSGDVQKTSLAATAFENPYLSENLTIQNALEKSNLFAGIKGNLGLGLGFKVKAFYKQVENLPLLVNSSTNLSRFDIIYDAGESKITGFEGEFDIKASEVFNFVAKLQTIKYNTATEAKAWFKPGIRLESEAHARLNAKLNLKASFVYNGETYGKIGAQAVKVKSFMDLNAGVQYQLTNKWGIHLQANNLLGKAYQQYLYYSKLGLNLFGGIHYSF